MIEHDLGGQPCDYAVSMPATEASIDLFQDVLQHLWRVNPDVEPRVKFAFESAAVEILANIVRHAFEADSRRDPAPAGVGRRLDAYLARVPDRVTVHFVDNGQPAELDLSAVTMPGEEAESGRGLAMAMAALDQLDYERSEGRNRWRLTCHTA